MRQTKIIYDRRKIMKFSDMKVKDVLANKDIMKVIKEYIPDLEKYPVKLLQNKKVADIIELAKSKGLCTDDDVKQLTEKVEELVKNL